MLKPSVAIVGATGAVGLEILKCLEKRDLPISSLKLLASGRSKNKKLSFQGRKVAVEELKETSFHDADIAFFSAGSAISQKFAPLAVQQGCIVIDNSSVFRMHAEVPLIIPEINPEKIQQHKGIIANPNCSTIIAITPLWPIHIKNRIRRLIISTYQAASGTGAAAINELTHATRAHLDNVPYQNYIFPHPYAFNLFSHNSTINRDNGYNEEEIKIANETKKIFNDPHILVSATCIRVPILRAHSESINFECERPITSQEVLHILNSAPGVKIIDDIENNYFPMPKDATGKYDILAGRIRQDMSDPTGKSIALFLSCDQLLKGAALNAVQIAELLHRAF